MRPAVEIGERLKRLERGQLRRAYPGDVPGGPASVVDTRSNDYLGLAAQGVSRETAGAVLSKAVMLGAGAARLVSGTTAEHFELERELAEWLRVEAALLFSSAYAANLGVLASLGERGDTILSDALNHASIIDGCRLSRAEVVVYPHLDVDAVAAGLRDRRDQPGQRWVVTESYFGMDGNSPDLAQLRSVCDGHDAGLIVDEAHALGVFGDEGRGLCFAAGIAPDVLVGGLGKAFGAQGGFVAAPRAFVEWFWNRARTFVFSTASSPLLTMAARSRLAQVRGDERGRESLRRREERLERRLGEAGVPLPQGRRGPIFPIVLGTEEAALGVVQELAERGVRVQAIRPPTVPPGTARLRIIVRADMTDEDVDVLAVALIRALRAQRRTGGAGETPAHDPSMESSVSVSPGVAPAAVSPAPAGQDEGRGASGEGSTAEQSGPGRGRATAGSGRGKAIGGTDASDGPAAAETGPDRSRSLRSGAVDVDPRGVGVPRGGARSEWSPATGALVLDPGLGAVGSDWDVRSGGGREQGALERGGIEGMDDPRGVISRDQAGGDGRIARHPGGGGTQRKHPAPEAPPGGPAAQERWIVLGTGTGVGKTHVAAGLVRVLARSGAVAGLKPIETGLGSGAVDPSDAASLEQVSFHVKHPAPHPLYAFERPVTPSLAARLEHCEITPTLVKEWLNRTASADPHGRITLVIETAGGVFSPLGPELDNFQLALQLGPARWVLVGTDRLGVLHEVASALHAMRALGRSPDCIVLNAPAEPDESTGTNLQELREMGVALPIVRLARGEQEPLTEFTELGRSNRQPDSEAR